MSRVELCWDCHGPLGDDHVTYLPRHHEVLGGSRRNAHGGCVPEGATVVAVTGPGLVSLRRLSAELGLPDLPEAKS